MWPGPVTSLARTNNSRSPVGVLARQALAFVAYKKFSLTPGFRASGKGVVISSTSAGVSGNQVSGIGMFNSRASQYVFLLFHTHLMVSQCGVGTRKNSDSADL